MANEQNPQKLTTIFQKNAEAYLNPQIRRALNEGGTSSSKTYSILQLLDHIAKHAKTNITISVVSESMPHLKRGCIKDFKSILGEGFDDNRFNKTEAQYHYPKATIEFFGADESSKVRGPRREILFINEANNIPWETARALDIRTSKFTFVDWNPVATFWVHEYWVGKPENAYIHSTYMDSKWVLPAQTIADIESYRDTDKNWWNVYGLGLIGKLDNLIWPRYEIVDDLPAQCDWQAWAYGLDFGFTNPAALVKIVLSDGRLYWHECLYQPKLTNADIIERLTHEARADIYADSAEPDRIEEICRAGYNCYPANKDVKMGLDVVKRQTLYITKESTNLIKEIRNYCYKKDKDERILEEPIKINDHLMDAGRYGTLGITERFGFATAKPRAVVAAVQYLRPSIQSARGNNNAVVQSFKR